MKRNAIIRIVLWSITLLVLLSILFTVLFAPGRGRWLMGEKIAEATAVPVPATEQIVKETVYEEPLQAAPAEPAAETVPAEAGGLTNAISLSPAEIQHMEIEWASGSIVIQPKDIDVIRIAENGLTEKSEPMVWNLRNGKLSIQYSKHTEHAFGMGLLRGEHSKDLIIQVPRDWQCASLEIDAAAATLEVNDLTIREMEFDGASGTCIFHNCTAEKLDLDTASGDVLFKGSLTQLDCDAASANIILELTNVPSRMELDTASGDLDVVLPSHAGFTVNMETLSGKFESDFDTFRRGDSYVTGNGSCRIDVDAMSGNVRIRQGA